VVCWGKGQLVLTVICLWIGDPQQHSNSSSCCSLKDYAEAKGLIAPGVWVCWETTYVGKFGCLGTWEQQQQ
jgi:hypothetical protein